MVLTLEPLMSSGTRRATPVIVVSGTTQPGYVDGVYSIDIARDVAFTLRFVGREATTPRDFVRPVAARHVFAIASARDPRPLLTRIAAPLRRVRPRSSSGS